MGGGECGVCGATRGLHFHHTDPASKVTEVTRLGFYAGFAEATKCVILCSSCHADVHEGLFSPLVPKFGTPDNDT